MKRVGFRLPDWATGFGFRLFEGLLEFQRTAGAMELQFDQPSGGDLPSAPIDASWEGDGLLVYRHTLEEAEAWAARGVAVVNLSTEFPGGESGVPRVTVDNRALGRAGAEHLAALGLHDFAYVHESTRRYSDERLEAFREAVLAGGGSFYRITGSSSRRVRWCPGSPPVAWCSPMRW